MQRLKRPSSEKERWIPIYNVQCGVFWGGAHSFTLYDMQSNRKPDNSRQEGEKQKKQTKQNEEYISKNESLSESGHHLM